jgi:hypothetical protein
LTTLRNACVKFQNQIREYYNNTQDDIATFRYYLGFIKTFAPERYRNFTRWQREDMEMSIANPLIDTSREVLETAWNYSRRGGKSRGLTVLAVFFALIGKLVIWRSPHADQLGQASQWFAMNPFVKKVSINNLNKVEVYGSPDINISVLSAGKVASREADILIYDEGGWVFKHLALYEFYKASRPMVAASQYRHIIHASTPARNTAFHEEWENLQDLEIRLNTKFTSLHPHEDCEWITDEWIEMEREKNSDTPWYVDQNYNCMFVVYGGAVFTNVIALGDAHFPEFPYGYLDKIKPRYTGVDFNGDVVGHYIITIDYNDNFVFVLSEQKFTDLRYLLDLDKRLVLEAGEKWTGYDRLGGVSIEVEDGQFNIPFCNDLRRMGFAGIYQEWNRDKKHTRVQELRNRVIVIDKLKCPLTYRNLMEASYDQGERLPKLEKRTDQHGLDGLLHAIHDKSGVIYTPKHVEKVRKLFGGDGRENPLFDV